MIASPTGFDSAGRITDGHAGWAAFSRLWLATVVGLFVVLVLALLAIDPYDTGRTGLIGRRGLQDQYPFMANASRARDPRFDAAIFGNSHVQQLNPERLDALTGLSFVSLMMPATWPMDGLDVLRWFDSNRTMSAKAVVIGLDQFWCMHVAINSQRFPTWLYADGFLPYLAGLVRYRSFEAAAARIRFARTGKGGYRPDGYWSYGPIYDALGLGAREASHRKLAAPKAFTINTSGRFPALDRLREDLADLPATTAVVLLRPPVYRTALPEPGTPEAETAASCRIEMISVARSRKRTVLIDLLGQDAEDPDGYYDHDHYRDPLAIRIEAQVAEALAKLRGVPATSR